MITQWFGGDSEHADIERHARSAVRFVYLHPLRDAAADLRPGRDNKLVGLVSALAPRGDADRDAIVAAAQTANAALDVITAIVKARTEIAGRLDAMTGGGRFEWGSITRRSLQQIVLRAYAPHALAPSGAISVAPGM